MQARNGGTYASATSRETLAFQSSTTWELKAYGDARSSKPAEPWENTDRRIAASAVINTIPGTGVYGLRLAKLTALTQRRRHPGENDPGQLPPKLLRLGL